MELNNNLIGFRFEYDSNLSIEQLQVLNNKTYIVYVAQFYQSDKNSTASFLLDIIDCTNPGLIGFKCLDFSKVANYTFSLNSENSLLTYINIMTYACQDLDTFKTSIPNNCANYTEINNIVNGINAVIRLKLYTSQFNTTSKEVQVNYRNSYVYTVANQSILSRIKTQKQITSVKTGYIIQSQNSFSSPIQYEQQDQTLDRQYAAQSIGVSCYSRVMIFPDELVQQIQIQFPTIPQVFAQVNSIFTLLMLLGIFGRAASNSSIKKEFFKLFLKNLYKTNFPQIQQFKDASKSEQTQILQDNLFQEAQKKNQKHYELTKQNNKKKIESEKLNFENVNLSEDEIKDEEKNSQCQKIPIFQYNPTFNMKKQKHDKSSFNNNKQSLQNPKDIILRKTKQSIILKKMESNTIQDEASKINFDTFFQKSSFDDKQTTSIITDSRFYSQNQTSYQKNIYKDKFLNVSMSFNSIEVNANNKNKKYKENQTQDFMNQINKNHNNKTEGKLKEIQDKSKKWKIIYQYLQKLRICKKRQKIEQIHKLSKIQKEKIQNHINQDLDILSILKDIIFIKKAVMILLKKDQLAAIKHIGLSTQILELDLKSLGPNLDKIKTYFSYYEMQHAILSSEKLQEYQIQKFLKRCSNNKNLTQIDNRILQSLKIQQSI
ncbi:AMP-binding enzyme family protein (macronuclear) [Tetrahymena thermophila SB210]|uniref:AMP-binding enzyme family protein n=1 Tax=Tetrahymena thermophila (strain SB210) TaxID=312017 RepID=Q229W2_TETTS|nr:AMP-binding enzyme family protein [Tetrahymena thermophila SB210]EAR82076.2 AMP-binding enzyme family protein [Tetrahymena thermophila SB210]|eukprot:XP_001029739.2 AMP-binding enzyme family protein [Tetrahymena thermophila SB210]